MRRFLAAALALIVLCAGGCASIFNADADEILTPTPAPVEMVPQAGGDLFIAIPDDITSFDPLTATNEDLINFLTLFYETPFQYDDSGQLLNYLIDSWTISEEGTVFTFRFRDDVYFADGEQLTADDVAASARRVLGRSGQAEPTAVPEEAEGEEETVNWQTALTNRFAAYNHDILSVEATGEFEVRVMLHEPGNAALHFMTFPVTKADFRPGDLPLGTGPYRMESYTQGEQAVLAVNEYWWRERPYIDRIVANAVSGPTQKMERMATSILDFVTTDAVNSSNYNVTGQWQVIDYMTDFYDCLVPNLQHPALRQVSVRRAISAALDRRELLSTVLLNHGVPSLLPIAPDYFAVDARYRSGQSSPSEAVELLEAAGYAAPEGEEPALQLELMVVDVIDSSYKREAARAIAKQLERVGIGVEVVALPEDEYLEALQTGDFDIAYCSYFLSEVPNLSFMFDVDGTGNFGHVDDPQLTEAMTACRRAVTAEETVAACSVLQERLSSLLPQIGLYFRMNSIICDEGIHGIHGARQNAVFSTISEWYNSYFAQPVQQTATAEPTVTQGHTEPEAAPPGTEASATPSSVPTAASWGPAPDPTPPGSEDSESTPEPGGSISAAAATRPSAASTSPPPAASSWGPAPDPTPPDEG